MPIQMDSAIRRLSIAVMSGEGALTSLYVRQVQEGLPQGCEVLANPSSHRIFVRLHRSDDYYRLPETLIQYADRIYYLNGHGEAVALKDRDGTVDVHLRETPPPRPRPESTKTAHDHLLDD